MDLLRAGVGAGALLAGIGVFYNYVILVPREQAIVQHRIAQQERQQKEVQLEKATAKARARQDLTICLSSAQELKQSGSRARDARYEASRWAE